MQKAHVVGMFLALSALSLAQGQYTNAASQGAYSTSPQAAPIVRAYPGGNSIGDPVSGVRFFDSQPNAGVSVRSDVSNGVQTVRSANSATELRVFQGRADVTIHHPADHSEILVDLPGGQVALLKDGFYTFNAGTNTVRVLHGEAEAYDGAKGAFKGTKVKETQQLALLGNSKLKAVNAYPYELTADLLPTGGQGRGDGGWDGSYGNGFYGGYPYYAGAYGYPWGYGIYPYGYGYPIGVGLGFGYYGGFRGGFRR
jgi:hypothetical protein